MCNANNYEIKTGQINLMDSDNTSVKSLDKINENRCGRSDDRDLQDNQHNSICARLESDQPEDTLVGSGLSLADNRLEDASQTQDGHLPRMASYTTQHPSSQKPTQLPSETISPRKNSPPRHKELETSSTKKPLVPKLKLSKVQMHRGVPKPLLTPQAGSKTSTHTLSLKTVNQKQATARQLNFQPHLDASEQLK